MATIPTSMPKPGQTGMPGNTGFTAPMNFGFMPGVRGGATQQDGVLSSAPSPPTPFTGNSVTGQVPIPYTANQYQSASDINNPFANYTGFNLGLNSAKELHDIYGPLGDAMYFYLNQGAGYNPAVLNSLINQIQPQVQQGLATLGSTAGMTGNRFGSAYQLGTSNFLSQVNQNELGMASNLYQHSQDTINQDMMSILGDAWQWKNNQASIWPLIIGSVLPTLVNRIPGLPSPNPKPQPQPGPPSQPPFSTPPIIPGGHYPPPTPPAPVPSQGGNTPGFNESWNVTDAPFMLQNYLNNPTQDNWEAYIVAAGGQGGEGGGVQTEGDLTLPTTIDSSFFDPSQQGQPLSPPSGTQDWTDILNQNNIYGDYGGGWSDYGGYGGGGGGYGEMFIV